MSKTQVKNKHRKNGAFLSDFLKSQKEFEDILSWSQQNWEITFSNTHTYTQCVRKVFRPLHFFPNFVMLQIAMIANKLHNTAVTNWWRSPVTNPQCNCLHCQNVHMVAMLCCHYMGPWLGPCSAVFPSAFLPSIFLKNSRLAYYIFHVLPSYSTGVSWSRFLTT